MSVAKVAIQFTAIDLLSKGVDKMKNRLDTFTKAGIDAQNNFNRMAKSFKIAGISGIVTKSIFAGLKPAITAASDLQAELLGVRSELTGSAKEVQLLEKRILSRAFQIQAWTPFDEAQIVATTRALLKSGASIESMLSKTGALAASAALAIQENLEPIEAGKGLIKIATPFQIAADKYFEVADLISRAASASPVGAREILETARFAALPVATAKKSIKELITLSAVLAKSGIDASLAGTGLRQFFVQAAKIDVLKDANGDLKEMDEIIRFLQLGFKGLGTAEDITKMLKMPELRDTNGQLKETADIIKILGKKPKTVGAADMLVGLVKLFGLRGAPIALGLMAEGEAAYGRVAEVMERANSLQSKVNTRMKGFGAQLTSLRGTSKSLISSLFLPALKPLTDILLATNEILTNFGEMALKKPVISEFISRFSLGALSGGAVLTGAAGIAGTIFGIKAIKKMGGLSALFGDLSSTLFGVAKGKALEATLGIKPVFVTNWPPSLGGAGILNSQAEGLNKKLNTIKKGAADGFGSLTAAAGGGVAVTGGTGFLSFLGRTIPSFLPKSLLTSLAGMGKLGATFAAPLGAAGVLTTTAVAGVGLGTGYLLGKLINQSDFLSNKLDRTVDFLFEKTPDLGFFKFATGSLEGTERIIRERSEATRRVVPTENIIREGRAAGEQISSPDIKNNINLNIRIDDKDRIITESSDDTRVSTVLNRGGFGAAL